MNVIYDNGNAEFTIPSGQKVAISAENSSCTVLYSSYPYSPESWSLSQIFSDSAVLIGAFSIDKKVRIEANGPGKILYSVGVDPKIVTRYDDKIGIGTIPSDELDIDGNGTIDGDLTVTGSITADDIIVGNIEVGGLIVGDPGTEDSGINIGGITYESSFKVSDIDGANYAQTILHRHSTVLEPLIVGARSNSDTDSHADVTAGQNVFSVYGAGWAGSNYKLFGSTDIGVDTTGTISNTSAPGRIRRSVTPNGTTTPAVFETVTNDGNVAFSKTMQYLQGVNTQTGTTYTLVATDYGKLITLNNASAITLTLPQQSTLTTTNGFWCKVRNLGAGTVTIVKQGSETLDGNTTLITGAEALIERPTTTKWAVSYGTAIVNMPAIGTINLSITTSNTKDLWCVQANATLLGIRWRAFSVGTAGTFKLQLNGADITGLTGLVPSTTAAYGYATTATNLVAGDVITIVADGTLATIADLNISPIFTVTY